MAKRGNPNIIEAGKETQWKKGHKIGRPKKPQMLRDLAQQLKDEGYEPLTQAQLREAFSLMLQYPKSEIIKIVSGDNKYPAIVTMLAQSILNIEEGSDFIRLLANEFPKLFEMEAVEQPAEIVVTVVQTTKERYEKALKEQQEQADEYFDEMEDSEEE